MIPATALILYSDFSKFPDYFKIFGWFMLITSVVLYFIPRQIHHNYSLKCAGVIKPLYFQLISSSAILIGMVILYSVPLQIIIKFSHRIQINTGHMQTFHVKIKIFVAILR